VAAYVPDLMDRSRMTAALPDVRFLASPSDLASADADVIAVDLTRGGVVPALAELAARPSRPRVVGFANHERRDLMEAARQAGADVVLARSAFFSRLPDVLS
jgi:DNA-binding NarL/FixJ family response regulator